MKLRMCFVAIKYIQEVNNHAKKISIIEKTMKSRPNISALYG
jgi:hypothetical protein